MSFNLRVSESQSSDGEQDFTDSQNDILWNLIEDRYDIVMNENVLFE